MAGRTNKQERELATQVRKLALSEISKALNCKGKGYDEAFKKQMLLKLATSILPRKTELGNEDGTPFVIKFDNSFNG